MRDDVVLRAEGIYHRYRAYLLRMWQEAPGARWRASLRDATSGETSVFGSVEDLVAFLQDSSAEDGSGRGAIPGP